MYKRKKQVCIVRGINAKCLLPALFAVCSATALLAQSETTLDDGMQELARRLLYAKQGSIIAIEPSTGEIKCLVSESYMADTINRAVEEYSPGSTFKVAQALTLVSEGILNAKSSYACNKGFWQGGVHIGCHPHRQPLTLVPAIGQSCNSYFCKAFAGMMNDKERYHTHSNAVNVWSGYMHSMGLGARLGVDIPDEKPGLIPDSAYLGKAHKGGWNGWTVMWVGMGQGEVLATPLQLCNLAASIANRGCYVVPHTKRYSAKDSLYGKYSRKHYCKPTAEAYELVVEGMRNAVTQGTARHINSAEYEICGKTGTAENSGRDHSVFIGFAPKENPRIAVAVYVENGGWGADLAAPLGALMIEQALKGELSGRSETKAEHFESLDVVPSEYDYTDGD